MYTGLRERKKSGMYEWSLIEMGAFFLLGLMEKKRTSTGIKGWHSLHHEPIIQAQHSTFPRCTTTYPRSCQVCIPRRKRKSFQLIRAMQGGYIQQTLCDLCLLDIMTGHLGKGNPKWEKSLSQAKLFLRIPSSIHPYCTWAKCLLRQKEAFFFVSVAVSNSSFFYRHRWNDELNFFWGGFRSAKIVTREKKKKKKDQTKDEVPPYYI